MEKEIDMTAHIPRGYANGVTREELHIWTGMSDRTIRAAIEWTSEHIETVFSYGGKYFLWGDANDDPYALAYARSEDQRFRTQSHKAARLRRFIRARTGQGEDKQIPGQMSLFE